jgi:TRAP-type C4-dicarboxylate transport system substrate-binding protein
MNQAAYDRLPADIQSIFDERSGVEISRAAGATTDKYDAIARKAAVDLGNSIVTLDEAETARWREAVQPTIEQWYTESKARHEDAMKLVAEESGLA